MGSSAKKVTDGSAKEVDLAREAFEFVGLIFEWVRLADD